MIGIANGYLRYSKEEIGRFREVGKSDKGGVRYQKGSEGSGSFCRWARKKDRQEEVRVEGWMEKQRECWRRTVELSEQRVTMLVI